MRLFVYVCKNEMYYHAGPLQSIQHDSKLLSRVNWVNIDSIGDKLHQNRVKIPLPLGWIDPIKLLLYDTILCHLHIVVQQSK